MVNHLLSKVDRDYLIVWFNLNNLRCDLSKLHFATSKFEFARNGGHEMGVEMGVRELFSEDHLTVFLGRPRALLFLTVVSSTLSETSLARLNDPVALHDGFSSHSGRSCDAASHRQLSLKGFRGNLSPD